MSARELITEHMDLWTGAVTKKSSSGRGSYGKVELTGIKKLRAFILQLAVSGRLVEQDAGHEPVRTLRNRIAATKTKLIKAGALRKQKPSPPLEQDKVSFTAPETWEWVTFGEITFNRDAERIPLSVSDRRTRSGDFDYYGASGIIDKIDDYLFDSPLLLIGEDGANLINRSTPIAFIARGKYWVNNHAHVIDGISENFLKFLCLYINATSLEPYVTGTAQPKMNQAKMNSIPVPLPPEEEQVRIVQKVDELMALCDQLEQQTSDQLEAHETLVDTLLSTLSQSENATELANNWARLAAHFDTLFTTERSIDKLKQTILQLAVMGRLVEQSPTEDDSSVLLQEIADEKKRLVETGILKRKKNKVAQNESQLFAIPSTWSWVISNEICTLITDGEHNTPERTTDTTAVPLATAKNVRDGHIDLTNTDFVPLDVAETCWNRCKPEAGDILMVSVGATLGRLAMMSDSEDMVLVRSVTLLRPLKVLGEYLAIYLQAPTTQSWIWRNVRQSAQPCLYLSKSSNIPVSVPPLAEQHRIVQKVDELMALCDQLKERLNQAGETRCQMAEAVVEGALN